MAAAAPSALDHIPVFIMIYSFADDWFAAALRMKPARCLLVIDGGPSD